MLENISEKVTGFTLLIFGIITILFTGFSVYQVFTAKSRPVELFHFDGIKIDIGQIIQAQLPPELAELNTPGKSMQEIIPANMVNEPLNISAHLFLMSFIGGIGFKLSKLGVLLIRPIVVKMKEKKEKTSNRAQQP